MARHRSSVLIALVALCLLPIGCSGAYASTPIAEEDASARTADADGAQPRTDVDASIDAATMVDVGAADGSPRDGALGDGGADGNRCMPTPPSCLQNATSACVNPCRTTYNTCKASCPDDATLRACLEGCAARLATCQQPCKNDCAVCANANGSCTGSQDCAAIVVGP